MRRVSYRLILGGMTFGAAVALCGAPLCAAEDAKQVEVTADQSLEWYQEQNVYIARGNAKAVRGDMTVEADLLTAHERDKPKDAATAQAEKKPKDKTANSGSGDIDKLTAEGNVRMTGSHSRVTGEHAVYDMDKHVAVVTGNNLKYETEKETVTAKDALEYWEDRQLAVARGHAVAVRADRHAEADVLTAEFRQTPAGESQLWKMTGEGNVSVVTKGEVARGDHMVYDAARNIAILNGHVRITRNDGTQLAGDVGEVDFANNKSRLLNQGSGRVRVLLSSQKKESEAPAAKAAP